MGRISLQVFVAARHFGLKNKAPVLSVDTVLGLQYLKYDWPMLFIYAQCGVVWCGVVKKYSMNGPQVWRGQFFIHRMALIS